MKKDLLVALGHSSQCQTQGYLLSLSLSGQAVGLHSVLTLLQHQLILK